MEPLLSIIIPVYKVEKYLPQCLESIVRQVEEEKGEVEVLVIDDGSPDASGNWQTPVQRGIPLSG